jgi:zinc transporter, ZIP family
VGAAFFWGAVAASTLLLGALLAYWFRPSPRQIGVVMAVGSGLLLGSVAFELIDEALKTRTVGWIGLFLFLGAGTFTVGDWILARRGDRNGRIRRVSRRKDHRLRSSSDRFSTASRSRSCSG